MQNIFENNFFLEFNSEDFKKIEVRIYTKRNHFLGVYTVEEIQKQLKTSKMVDAFLSCKNKEISIEEFKNVFASTANDFATFLIQDYYLLNLFKIRVVPCYLGAVRQFECLLCCVLFYAIFVCITGYYSKVVNFIICIQLIYTVFVWYVAHGLESLAKSKFKEAMKRDEENGNVL